MPGQVDMDSITHTGSLPNISVLIRTYNSARTLGEVLQGLHLEHHDELLVVDSGSQDSTLSIAESYAARIIHLKQPFHYSVALNHGFLIAKNPWVLVISSHTIPTDHTLISNIRHFATLASADYVVAYGAVDVVEPSHATRNKKGCYEALQGPDLSNTAGNSLAVYRKSAWEKRHFRSDIPTAEDLDWFLWARQAGYQAARLIAVHGVYRNQGSLRHMFRKGWEEIRQADWLVPRRPVRIIDDLIGYIYGVMHFLKLFIVQKISLSCMLRHQSHLLGAFMAKVLRRS